MVWSCQKRNLIWLCIKSKWIKKNTPTMVSTRCYRRCICSLIPVQRFNSRKCIHIHFTGASLWELMQGGKKVYDGDLFWPFLKLHTWRIFCVLISDLHLFLCPQLSITLVSIHIKMWVFRIQPLWSGLQKVYNNDRWCDWWLLQYCMCGFASISFKCPRGVKQLKLVCCFTTDELQYRVVCAISVIFLVPY